MTGPGDHGNWGPALGAVTIMGITTVVGTVWGGVEGVPLHTTTDLTLDGLTSVQREGVLTRFLLDEKLTHTLE